VLESSGGVVLGGIGSMFAGANIIVVSLVVLSLVAVAAAAEAKMFKRGRDALSC
jgi:hypothetical protein